MSEYHSSSQNFKPTLPNNPSREGYTFIGWDSDINNVPDTKEIFALYEMNNSTGKRSIESMFHNCSSFNKECIVNSSLTNTNNLFNHCNSLNSDIYLHFSEEKNTSNIYSMLTNTSVNMVYIKDYIDADMMNIFLNGLTNPTTIDIRENSLANILTIINNEEIMNKINYGIKGISHTLLWKDENYNYFNIVTNDTVGYQVTLYQPSLMSSEATLLESDLLTDWGDGTIDNLTSHTYSSSNNYLIKTKLSPGSGSGGSNNLNIIECENIRTGITDMDYFFSNCINLTEIKNFPDSITSLNHTFENCSSFISNIEIPTAVTSIDYLFSGCSSFKQSIITIPGSVTSMNGTFNGCTSLTSLNLSDSNVNAVTSMNNLFANCTSLKLLDLTNWNLGNISSASNMFTNDSNLNEIYMNNSNYSSINTILNSLPTRTKATAGFVFVDDLDNVNTIIANNVFWGVVSKFNYLTVTINNSNTKLSLYRNNRVDGTYEDLYETNWGDGTINSADNHTYSSAGTYTVKTKLQPGNKDVSANVITKPNDDTLITGIKSVRYDIESMDSFFFRLGNINNIDLTLTCNTKNVTQMRRLFGRSKNITYLDISNWNVENVTALSGAFTQDPLSSYFDISKWNPKNLVNAYEMFYGEYGFNVQFTSLDLSGWDTSKLENISKMFKSCTNLTTLNLSNWNLASVNNTADTFTSCSSLNSLIMKNSNAKSINLIISLLPSKSSGSAGTITVSDTTGIDTSAATSKNWNIVVE